MRRSALCTWISLAFLINRLAVDAEDFGGVEFPQGSASFADLVVSYIPPTNALPAEASRGPQNSLGYPDYDGQGFPPDQDAATFVSLGEGGTLVLRFVDNFLSGSGSPAFDLWVFEIGANVERTFIDISSNGTDWISVGNVAGGTRGIDIDAFGYGPTNTFSYVRLTDDHTEVFPPGPNLGADIDSVGAISTIVATSFVEAAIATAVEVIWDTESNATYFVQRTSNLDTGHWDTISQPLQGNGQEQSFLDSARFATNQYYRVLSESTSQ